MDNKEKDGGETKKPNRLKFSRLCLSQSRNAVSIRNNSQLQSSQISRFFSHSQPNDEKQHNTQIQTVHQSASDQRESVDDSKDPTNDCDNHETIESANQQMDNQIPTQTEEKRRKHSHRSKMVDTKSTIKSFFSNENNDSLSDFEIPNKVSKKVPKPLPSKTSKCSRNRRKQPDIRRALSKKEIAAGDFSRLPEEAQIELALAMSKAETVSGAVSDTSNDPFDLEKFEFKQSNAEANTDFLGFFNRNQKGKARFRWNSKCTQLTRRKDDVQMTKAREKIDEILLNNIIVESSRSQSIVNLQSTDYTSNTIYSQRLQRICVSERILFELNSCEEDTRCTGRSYYTNNLVEPSEYRAGILLKDWSRIPGRDSLYDGIAESGNENDSSDLNNRNDKTDAFVISSSPVYDPPSDDNESEHQVQSDDANSNEGNANNANNNIADVDQKTETAGCADVNQKCSISPMDTQGENEQEIEVEANNLDYGDATSLIDSDDIQLKVDAINSKIRSSQNFSDIFQAPQLTYESATTTRALSPDLFDDDDDIDTTEEIHKKPEEKSPIVQEDDDTVVALSNDVVVISSEDTNPASIERTKKSQDSNTQDTYTNEVGVAIDEVIEIPDSDSEPMLKDRIVSQTTQILSSSDKGRITPHVVSDYNVWDDDYENLLIQGVDKPVKNDFIEIEPTKNVSDEQNHLTESNGSVSLVKKMSFTERLGLFEQDMLNGFTADIPTEYLCQSQQQQQQQQQQLSQESMELSDDEINYSMCRNAVHVMNNDAFNMDYSEDNCANLPDPIEFNCRDSDSSTNLETEEKLVNQSICNIFEKTFEEISSPFSAVTKRKPIGLKSLKKVNSETVLSSRYDNPEPSTSKVNRTPGKKSSQFVEHKLPSNRTNSPLSQPSTETRMNLSNDDYIIQIGSISPKPTYEEMDTITLEMELRKFGLKPSLRRRQAIICLEYIYNRTHPLMESCNDSETPLEFDQQQELEYEHEANSQNNVENNNEVKDLQINFNIGFALHNLVDEPFKNREVSKVFLPSVPRAKKPWCLEPLHIAWHNLTKANPEVRKAVLLYAPINLIELKKYFKTIEMTFDNRDLISFFDLHCITFRMIKRTKE